jgi:hypothetical protein
MAEKGIKMQANIALAGALHIPCAFSNKSLPRETQAKVQPNR